MAPHKNGMDENICRWDECGAEFSDPDALYDHITTVHIGRKSAGTLSLECKWTGCNSKASKRDHLTSHARVHINLKPHVCEICSKAFKRPQDLKKHEKIHTEEHHVNHKHSKAVTIPSGAARELSNAIDPSAQNKVHDSNRLQPNQPHSAAAAASMQQQMGLANAYGFAGYPFGFPVFGQAPAGQSVDFSAFIAHQQKLNAQAAAGMHIGPMGYPSLPAYGAPHQAESFSQVGQRPFHSQAHTQAHAMQQMFAAQSAAMFPYGQAAFPYMQPGAMPINLAPSAPNADVRRTSAPATAAASATNVLKSSSLYPSLPQALNGLGAPSAPAYASVPMQSEDYPSPSNSAHSSQGSYYANSFHSSSVSPHVPALSPPSYSSPENLASPFSEQDSDSGSARHSNAGRGKKRGFEEAAGQFFGDLKNKRFQDEDAMGIHLDALSQFLLSPDSVAPSLTPARSNDDHSSSSSICSDYSTQAEVNQINELLLSLGQTIETKELNEFLPTPQQQNAIPQPPYTTSIYPSLAQMDRQYARAPVGSAMFGHHLPDPMRSGKSIAAPTLVNDLRAPQYTTVGRLHRAAPLSYRDQQQSFDDYEEESIAARKSYSSSIRTTSFDEMEDEPTKLAPIRASSSPSSALNSLSARASLTLPSIAFIVPPPTTEATAPVSLPSIRALLDAVETTARNDSTSSPSPSSSSSSSSSSSPASPPLRSASSPEVPVRSFTTDSNVSISTVRPGSSSGVVDRLTRRVHKLDVHPAPIQDEKDEDALLLEASSDEDEDGDHPSNSKRIRFESPEPIDQEEDSSVDANEDPRQQAAALAQANLIKQRRMFVLKTLIAHLNASYRAKLAAEALQKAANATAA
ncbi:BQ2448_3797 [Microbotryum intermedium]|uniref:BQ2448_3797 protein n=1 Tax=Microbotryum intermedium TaxID=269621 RepID=A0A238FCW5_9BASI|nr:BQ2448_3797 [Microbotryum intermedium]